MHTWQNISKRILQRNEALEIRKERSIIALIYSVFNYKRNQPQFTAQGSNAHILQKKNVKCENIHSNAKPSKKPKLKVYVPSEFPKHLTDGLKSIQSLKTPARFKPRQAKLEITRKLKEKKVRRNEQTGGGKQRAKSIKAVNSFDKKKMKWSECGNRD